MPAFSTEQIGILALLFMMTPLKEYRREVKAGRLHADPDQEQVVRLLQKLFDELIVAENRNDTFLARLKQRITKQKPSTPQGLYIWGSVGRGKTLLVDMFFHNLPFNNKLRMHFHRFMQMIHHELRTLPDTSDPMPVIAERLSQRARVICFDEFHVADITDAMLLANLLKALFDRDVVLVATSNTEPRYLYWGGLQRERFLPAIEQIEQHTRIVRIEGDTDHRLLFLDHAEIYHAPLDDEAERCLENNFINLAPGPGSESENIEIEGRSIETVREADGVIWFEFEAICGGPRSAVDYIEIARTYQAVLVANVPQFDSDNEDKAKRLINLVDELYDRRVKLIISAAAPPDGLYRGKRHVADFQRTVSRLHEMRCHSYLAGSHRP